MANGMLSKEEIDALLSGAMDSDLGTEDSASWGDNRIVITDLEKDAIGEIANISMGTAATTLSQIVGKRVEITTPKVDIISAQKIFEEYPIPHVLIDVKYKRGIEGSNMLILSRRDGSIIVDLMMGGQGLNPTDDLNEIQLSGISEAMNQMMGSAATSMSTVFNAVVEITPPRVVLSDTGKEASVLLANLNASEPLVRISFRMVIEGVLDSFLLQVIPMDVAKRMATQLLGGMTGKQNLPPQEPKPEKPKPKPTPAPSSYQAPPPPPPAPQGGWQASLGMSMPPHAEAKPTFVQPAQFAPLNTTEMPPLPNNLELIYDVPLQVSVELGKATKTIKEILELGPGAVIELDRLAGEPVDMIVNGKLIAKCEVVVINETFGIRITEIVNPDDRIDTFN
ncbi:MAG TPA: flagellar motor switch phosphatase FliY [Peptococcaceae bacterium]|nr:flagellar motor switch phosphatase FliY [Peptococcaceae bacterium]